MDRAARTSHSYLVWKKLPISFRDQSMLTTPFSMSSASPLSNGSAIYKRTKVFRDYNLKTESLKFLKIRLLLTIVILFFLLGVSAKHFIDEDSTTVSQNETTGSATYKQKHIHQEKKKIKF